MTLRLTRRELVELINSMESFDQDTAHLRALLTSLPPERASQRLSPFRDEEVSTADYLDLKVGDLFPNRVDDDVLAQLIEIDGQYTLGELRAMCKQAALSTGGDKKILAAKLLAGGFIKEKEMVSTTVDLSKQREWQGEPGKLNIPDEYLKPLQYEVVVFARKERGGNDFVFQCKGYMAIGDRAWKFSNVIINTSIRNAKGEVELFRLTYHPEIVLVNIGFMVMPLPEGVVTPQR